MEYHDRLRPIVLSSLFLLVLLLFVGNTGKTLGYVHTNLLGIALLQSSDLDAPVFEKCSSGEENILRSIDSQSVFTQAPPSLPAGMYYWSQGNCTDALQVWGQVTQLQPQNHVVWYWLGIAMAETGNGDFAARAIKLAGAEYQVVAFAARAYAEGNVDKTRQWLTIAAKIGGREVYTYVYEIALSYYYRGEGKKAATFLRFFGDALPADSIDRFRTYGMMERLGGNVQQAVDYYELALQHDPNDLDILQRLRSIWLDTGNYEKALPIVLREAELTPPNPQHQALASLAVAWVYRLLQDYSNARQWAMKAKTANPGLWAVYKELGVIDCLDGRKATALEYLDKAMQLSNNSFDARRALSACLYRLGDAEQAIQIGEELVREFGSDSKLIPVYLDLGQWYEDTGKRIAARDLYIQGLRHWPNAHWLQSRLDRLSGQ